VTRHVLAVERMSVVTGDTAAVTRASFVGLRVERTQRADGNFS
jgi:hypothetical protein